MSIIGELLFGRKGTEKTTINPTPINLHPDKPHDHWQVLIDEADRNAAIMAAEEAKKARRAAEKAGMAQSQPAGRIRSKRNKVQDILPEEDPYQILVGTEYQPPPPDDDEFAASQAYLGRKFTDEERQKATELALELYGASGPNTPAQEIETGNQWIAFLKSLGRHS